MATRNSTEKDAADKRFAGREAGAIAMLPVTPRFARGGRRWGVVLAGGDGTRLQKLTRLICGDERPKQFCPLFGGKTLLEQTLQRSERSIPREQILVSLAGQHNTWYSREAGLHPSQRVVQPANKGTAPPILHSLLSLAQLDERALVAILPCDHHYSDEDSFTSSLECAFETAAERTDSVVLLGAKPNYPETDYGWIELGPQLGQEGSELFRVRRFQEKPSIDVAQKLLERDSVWNTFVMVGHVQAFLRMVRATLPDLCRALAPMRLWAGRETHIERSLYERVPSVSFSDGVLAADTGQLVVLRLNEVGWSDLGDPGRAFLAAREIGCALEWTEHLGLGGLAKGPAAETSGKAAAVAIA